MTENENLSKTQLKWKQKYRRLQQAHNSLLVKHHELEEELARYRAAIAKISPAILESQP